jgi:TolB-like protein
MVYYISKLTKREINIMMRAFAFIFLFIFHCSVSYADIVDDRMQAILNNLSLKYNMKYPSGVTKKGIAVLDFTESSEKAKAAGIGTTVRENLSRRIITSNIFYLADRDTLHKSMREIELSQTGLVDDNSLVKAGRIAGVQIFIRGTVSDIADDFLVSCKIIDVETGIVVAMADTRIPQNRLIEVKEKYAYEYIAQYGLGINVQVSYMPAIKCPINNYTSYMIDSFLNYRPKLWLNFKLGVSYYTLEFDKIENIQSTTVFPTVSGAANYTTSVMPGDPTLNTPVTWQKSKIDFLSPYIGLDYNWTPSRLFTIGFGLGLNFVKNIEYVQQYDKGYHDLYPETTHAVK